MDLQTLPVVKHIGRLKYATGWKNSSTLSTNVFFLVVSGEFCFRTSKTNFVVPDKTMLFLPAGTSYTVKVDRDCDYFYLHLDASQKAVRAFSGSKDAALDGIQPPARRKEEKTVRFNEIISFDDDAFVRIFYLFPAVWGQRRKADLTALQVRRAPPPKLFYAPPKRLTESFRCATDCLPSR